jgi:hypothetical protein
MPSVEDVRPFGTIAATVHGFAEPARSRAHNAHTNSAAVGTNETAAGTLATHCRFVPPGLLPFWGVGSE